MPTTFPAMKGRMGDTEYFILTLKAGELVTKVRLPKDVPNWETLTIEERYQRDINYGRVTKQIAPYLANNERRFFGALIVTAVNFNEEEMFEPLSATATKALPNLYRAAAEEMGFLTLRGGEILVPLDGQHRLAALDFAISGKNEKGRDIPGITSDTSLAKDDVTVILVPFEPKRARRIFTKVNRYARPTTTGQNLVTDDDDYVAVLSRAVANEHLDGRLARYESNTLGINDEEFTTLSVVYNCTADMIVRRHGFQRLDKTQPPDRHTQKLWRKTILEIWQILLAKIDVFADALRDKSPKGDKKRMEIRKENLLGKPVAQECLVKAFLLLTTPPHAGFNAQEACRRLNKLPWGITEGNVQTWQRVLWDGGTDGKIITKRRSLAVRMIHYMAGGRLEGEEIEELLRDYRAEFPEGERANRDLPARLA